MPLPSRWERAVWKTWEMASSVLLFKLQGVEGGGKHWAYESFNQALKHLLTMGMRAIGRQPFRLVTFCCLGMGMMALVLKQVGTELMESD